MNSQKVYQDVCINVVKCTAVANVYINVIILIWIVKLPFVYQILWPSHSSVLHCTALYCTVQCTALYCSVLHSAVQCTVLHCIAQCSTLKWWHMLPLCLPHDQCFRAGHNRGGEEKYLWICGSNYWFVSG